MTTPVFYMKFKVCLGVFIIVNKCAEVISIHNPDFVQEDVVMVLKEDYELIKNEKSFKKLSDPDLVSYTLLNTIDDFKNKRWVVDKNGSVQKGAFFNKQQESLLSLYQKTNGAAVAFYSYLNQVEPMSLYAYFDRFENSRVCESYTGDRSINVEDVVYYYVFIDDYIFDKTVRVAYFATQNICLKAIEKIIVDWKKDDSILNCIWFFKILCFLDTDAEFRDFLGKINQIAEKNGFKAIIVMGCGANKEFQLRNFHYIQQKVPEIIPVHKVFRPNGNSEPLIGFIK